MTKLSKVLAASIAINVTSNPATSQQVIQWSQRAHFASPDGRWQLVVIPRLSGAGNDARVELRSKRARIREHLFQLTRVAQVYWSQDASRLLILNEPFSGSKEILFFAVSPRGASELRVDRTIRDKFLRMSGGKEIVFFTPTLAAWGQGSLVLAVGGTTANAATGPTKSHCFGLVIDSMKPRVIGTISSSDLKRRYRADCQTSP
jgi:hypothetical protein